MKDILSSIFTFILALIACISFWYFVLTGYNFGGIYPIVGAAIAIHGALGGIILWQYLEYKGLLFIEWWDKIFKRK